MGSSCLWLGSRFHQRVVGAADHFVERAAGWNHRVDGIFLFDAEVDQNRVFAFTGGADGWYDISARSDALAADAEGVGQGREVGSDQRGGDVPLVVEELLPLAD